MTTLCTTSVGYLHCPTFHSNFFLIGRNTQSSLNSRNQLPFPVKRTCIITSEHKPSQHASPSIQENSLGKKSKSGSLVAIGIAALAAVAFLEPADIAWAYRGGGPYGIGVTRGQDLSGQDFSGKDLTKQDFKTSILRQANFKGSKLVGASFFDADLTGADLSDADVRGADFSLAAVNKANLSNALLEGISVTGNTSFKGTNVTGADFTDVLLRDDQKTLLCKNASGTNPVTGNDTRETLLCDY